MPNQYTRKPLTGQVVPVRKRCATCGRQMVAHFMGEDAWCPVCTKRTEQNKAAADEIAKSWGR